MSFFKRKNEGNLVTSRMTEPTSCAEARWWSGSGTRPKKEREENLTLPASINTNHPNRLTDGTINSTILRSQHHFATTGLNITVSLNHESKNDPLTAPPPLMQVYASCFSANCHLKHTVLNRLSPPRHIKSNNKKSWKKTPIKVQVTLNSSLTEVSGTWRVQPPR